METQHIRYIQLIAEHRNISAAARDLGMTQPALTKIISRVEDIVGAKLFDRGPRGAVPTPFGELFLNRMTRVEAEIAAFADEVKAKKSGMSGTISLAVGQFWLGNVLPQVIAHMATALPDVQFKISTGPREHLLDRLKTGEADLMLGRVASDIPEDVNVIGLGEVGIFLVARAGHPLSRLDREPTAQELQTAGWVLPPAPDPSIQYAFSEVGREPPAPRVETVSQNFIQGLLLGSDMVTIVPDFTANTVAPGLCRLRADWLQWRTHVGVIQVQNRTLLPCCQVFLDHLHEVSAGLWGPAPPGRAKPTTRTRAT